MNKDKRNNIQLLGTLNNADESGIIANANQVYDANEDKSTQDVSKEHKERIETLETKESSMQTTLENITKTSEASAASNVTYNHNDSHLDATNIQQAIDEVRKRSNYNDGENIIDFNTIHIIKDNPEFVIAIVDTNNRILYGIKFDGQPYWGIGVPKVVRDYVDKQVNDILGTDNITEAIDSLKEVEKFLSDFKNSDTLKALLDTKANKTDVNNAIANTNVDIMNKYKQINTDIVNKYKKSNPNDEEGNIIDTNELVNVKSNKEYIYALIDNTDTILVAIDHEGKIYYGNGIPPQVQGAINKAVEDLQVDITNEHLDDIETRIPQDSDNPEFISIITDKSGNTPLLWINSYGEIDWAKGIPAPLKKYIEEKVSAVNFGSSAYTPSKLSESLFRCSPNCEAQLGMNGIDSDHLVEYATIAKNIGTKIARIGIYSWVPYNAANPTIDAIRRTYDKEIYKLKKLGYEVMGDFSPYNWYEQRYAYDKSCNTFDKYMEFEIEAIKLFCSRYHNAYYDGADYISDEDYEKHFISKDEYEKLSYEDKKPFVDMNMKYFESINEWDTNCLGRYGFNWTGNIDEDGNPIKDYNVAIANCFKFWKTMHLAIKEVNPEIIHVLGGTTCICPQIFVDLCDYQEDPEGNRFWEFFDIYNFHSYANSISLYNSTLSLKNLMDRVFDNNKEDNLLDKPVYCTEFGDNTYTSSYEGQAIAMAQKLILLSASGVSSMFPYRLRTFEQDRRNNAWGGTEEDYYGIIHPGVTNSKIAWLRNDGSNKAISVGDGLLDMIFLRNDVRLVVTSYVEERLKESGLLIKGAGYTITRVSKIISNVETDIYTTSTVLPKEGGTISLDKSNFQDVNVGDFVVVYADGVDISGNWKGLDPKPAFIALKAFMERFHPDGSSRPVIGYDKEQKCYTASWLDANNKSVHALWSIDSIESKSAKISYTNRNVDVFDYLGNKLIIEDNLINLTSKVTYIIGAGRLTLKF